MRTLDFFSLEINGEERKLEIPRGGESYETTFATGNQGDRFLNLRRWP
jgi:hypothetical protein